MTAGFEKELPELPPEDNAQVVFNGFLEDLKTAQNISELELIQEKFLKSFDEGEISNDQVEKLTKYLSKKLKI